MADALCGPSNALQSFKSHTSVDRSLQQDRLISRRPPAQGFRSHDPNAGILDPEFEAFQAGHPIQRDLPTFHSAQHLQQPHHASPGAHNFAGPSQAPDWAADFQRLQVSPSPALQHHQTLPQAQNVGWDGVFQNHSRQAQKAPVSSPSYSNFQSGPSYGMYGGFSGGYSQQQLPMQTQAAQQNVMDVDQFDEAAFERAFDTAREEMEAEELQNQGLLEAEQHARDEVANQKHLDNRSGVDIYPHLTLLRLRMFDLITQNTEDSIHELALMLSFLEQHDDDFVVPHQAALFRPILSHLFERRPEQMPFAARYDINRRAEALYDRFTEIQQTAPEWASMSPKEQKLRREYMHHLPGRIETNHLVIPTTNLEHDLVMQQEIQERLEAMENIPLDERVQQSIRGSLYSSDNVLQTASSDKVIQMAFAELAYNVQQIDDDQAGTFSDDPLAQIKAVLNEASQAPEVIEAREAQRAQQASLQEFQRQLREDVEARNPVSNERRLAEEIMERAREESEQEKQQNQTQDDDALAQTAAELLEKVSDNSTDKFRNSAFLGLMRKLADREVKVEGDKMVDTNAYGSSNGRQETHELNDGQEVVDLLNQPGVEEPPSMQDLDPEFMMTSPYHDPHF